MVAHCCLDACSLHQTLMTGLWKTQTWLYKQSVEVWRGVRQNEITVNTRQTSTCNYTTVCALYINTCKLHSRICLPMHEYMFYWCVWLIFTVCPGMWGNVYPSECNCICVWVCVCLCLHLCVHATAINVARRRWQQRVMDRLCATGWVFREGHCYIQLGRDNVE